MIISTCVTNDYLNKAEEYFSSYSKNVYSLPLVCLCLGFEPDNELKVKYNRIHFRAVEASNVEYKGKNNCLQHGGFSKFFNDEIIIFIDAGVVFQRDITEEEISKFRGYDDNTIGLSWNSYPLQTLLEESYLLEPVCPQGVINSQFRDIPTRNVYNTGFMAGRNSMFKRVNKEFISHTEVINKCFSFYARQQWLISWILQEKDIKRDILPYSYHVHGQYALPKEVALIEGETYYQGVKTFVRCHV